MIAAFGTVAFVWWAYMLLVLGAGAAGAVAGYAFRAHHKDGSW